MALTNYSLPFGGLTTQNWAATISPLQPHHATAVNSLLYGPAGHQESDEPPAGVSHQDYYKNNPYSPPQSHQFRSRPSNNYLPPPPSSSTSSSQQQQHQQQHRQDRGQQFNQPPRSNYLPPPTSRTYGEENYDRVPTRSSIQQTGQYFNGYNTQTRTYSAQQSGTIQPPPSNNGGRSGVVSQDENDDDSYPERPSGFTRVKAGQGSRTQVHAILDYDADENDEGDYYDEDDQGSPVNTPDGQKTMPTVTPIQGPIFLKNGTVPVVPLFSYPTINNGTFVQIPIWWTALSVALGLEISGDVIRGVPCVKRYNQLFCPTAGNSYPIDKIERFIDDNKALMRRMYGDFEMTTEYGPPLQQNKKRKRSTDEPDFFDLTDDPDMISKADKIGYIPDTETGDTYFGKLRDKRQSSSFRGGVGGQNKNRNQKPNRPGVGTTNQSTGRVDACESKIEIVTPYWASNSAGKIRAIVNTQHFEQAIHQEICTKVQTSRCGDDCGCEQKYKWHRLLAYDPDNDCKGIFMDWFLFPSCCVCRCAP